MALAFTSTQAPSKVDIDWALGIGRYWGMVMKGRVGWELGVGLVEVPRGRLDRKARSEKARWKAARIGVRSRRQSSSSGVGGAPGGGGGASGKLPLPQAFRPTLPPTARGPRGIINVTDYVINAQQK